MTAQWENSLISQTYTDLTGNTVLKIDLSNFFEWNLRLVNPPPLGVITRFTIWFKDPAQYGETENGFNMTLTDPTMLAWEPAGALLSSNGVKYLSNQATIWVRGDSPDTQYIVWGSRRS